MATAAECRAALRLRVPELFQPCDRVCALVGAAPLAGIGFTMSLFIGTLAWDTPGNGTPLGIGVLAGSLLSGISGYLMLRCALRGAMSKTAASDR